MAESLKIIIPMAGWGTRMRPHTWNKPKPLVSVAGRTALDYLMDMFQTVPRPAKVEYIFIVGPYLGETQIPAYIQEHYPEIQAHYVVQAEMKGQSHALYLARQHLTGPMLMCFSDTLIETDFSFLDREKCDAVAWVKAIPDPRRFGVAEVNPQGWVTRLIEKPQSVENNLAVVGCYYFKNSESLLAAIEQQMERDIQLKNEYFLVDAINILLENHALMRVEKIETWLDTGTIEATLDTNRQLLEQHHTRLEDIRGKNIKIVEPVFIHESAVLEDSTIGPFASIGANCRISHSFVENSILDAGCEIRHAALRSSMLGRQVKVQGRSEREFLTLNLGDDSSTILG